jgi:chemotaxis response regulator CheB
MIVEALRTDYPMTKTQIRVLVVAAEVIHRQAVRRAIAVDADADFVLFEAATGQEGLQLTCHLKPDCILLDDNCRTATVWSSSLRWMATRQRCRCQSFC